jgi:hypothetical protein
MRGTAAGTIPVRISYAIYREVGKHAEANRRTIRAEIELMLEQQLELLEQPKLEQRKGAPR